MAIDCEGYVLEGSSGVRLRGTRTLCFGLWVKSDRRTCDEVVVQDTEFESEEWRERL